MPDNLRECQQIIQQTLDSSLVSSHAFGDNSPVLMIERHLCVKPLIVFPAFKYPILMVHLGGGKVSTTDLDLFSLPSFAAIPVTNKKSRWHTGGTFDVACIYFTEKAQAKLLRAIPKEAGALVFSDALVNALARELLDQEAGINKSYFKTLSKTLMLQLIKVAKRSGKRGSDLYFGQNNIFSINEVLNYIHNHLAEDLSSEHLAIQVSLSTSHFRRLFLRMTKRTPHKYIQKRRLERARELIITTDQPLADIATEVGYSDQAHMTRRLKEAYGVSPAKFRKSSRNY